MPAVFNVKTKARTDADGNIQRQKYQGVASVSLAYGLYLGESCDDLGTFKVFFLMTSWVSGTGEFVSPAEIRSNPRMASMPLDVFPFSKKFSVADDLVETLVAGSEYWFLYTSEPVSKPINGKMITYEQLDLICVADSVGADGIKSLLPYFKLKFQSNS